MNNKRTDLEPWRPAGKVFRIGMDDANTIKRLNNDSTQYLRRITDNSNVAAIKANAIIHRMIETVLDEDER